MNKLVTRSAMLAATAAMLSGCQILGIHRLSGAAADPAPAQAASAPSSALQAGRQALDERRYGAAIDAFNIALASGENPAAAYNGLAVAYSRLGRDDLAYRFFSKAAMSDPANPVYARNLAMLVDSPGFTLRTMAVAVPQPALVPAPQPALAANDRGARLVRGNGHQFSLVTIDPDAASPAAATRSAAAAPCAAARRRAACPAVRLPQVGSRNAARRSAAVANADAAPRPAPKAEPIAALDPAPPAPGKRKVYDLSTLRDHAKPAGDKPDTAAVDHGNS